MLEPKVKRGARWSLTVENPAPGLVFTTIAGHVDLSCTQAMWDHMDLVFMTQSPIQTFHDWAGLDGYDANVRPAYVAWSRSRRAHFKSVNILVTSKLVAMGVSVANLALGYLTAYANRGSFERARARSLADLRGAGSGATP